MGLPIVMIDVGKLQLAEHPFVSCSGGWDQGPSEHVTMVCQDF